MENSIWRKRCRSGGDMLAPDKSILDGYAKDAVFCEIWDSGLAETTNFAISESHCDTNGSKI